jgi:hypothetical protein
LYFSTVLAVKKMINSGSAQRPQRKGASLCTTEDLSLDCMVDKSPQKVRAAARVPKQQEMKGGIHRKDK